MAIAKPISAALTAIASLTLIALLGGSPRAAPPAPGDADPDARLTRPTRITLDFRDRTITEVVREIGRRSGRTISDRGGVPKDFPGEKDPQWRQRRVTLEAAEPVPLWEAIDRLAEAGRIGYRMGDYGDTGAAWTGVVFEESGGGAGGLVQYSGPFRVALTGLHRHRDVVFVRGPWVQVYPSGSSGPIDANELASAPPDGGLLYAELQVLAEPGLICRRNGPLRALEAVDDRGRERLAPAPARPVSPWTLHAVFDVGVSPALRVPLRRPDVGPASTTLRRLRGTIPVEIAVVRPTPALVVPLKGSEGKTLSGGGYTVRVETARAESDGRVALALTFRPDGAMEPEVQGARLSTLMKYQFRFVDARGQPVHFASGSVGGDGHDWVQVTFQYRPDSSLGTGPPDQFRLFDLERVAWEIPFEFRDVPLP